MCAGTVPVPSCTSDQLERCTLAEFGPCVSPDGQATAPFTVQVSMQSLMLASGDPTRDATTMHVTEGTVIEKTRILDGECDGIPCAYSSTVAFFGDDPATFGAQIGVAYYAPTTSTPITWNANSFPSSIAPEGSTIDDSVNLCIGNVNDDGSCEGAVDTDPGEFRFSLFGRVMGSEIDQRITDHIAMGHSKLAVRMELSLRGAHADDLAIQPVILRGSLHSLIINPIWPNATSIELNFPQTYNFGVVDEEIATVHNGGSKTVQIIFVSTGHGSDSNKVYIDFMFDLEDLNTAGGFVVYDYLLPQPRALPLPHSLTELWIVA